MHNARCSLLGKHQLYEVTELWKEFFWLVFFSLPRTRSFYPRKKNSPRKTSKKGNELLCLAGIEHRKALCYVSKKNFGGKEKEKKVLKYNVNRGLSKHHKILNYFIKFLLLSEISLDMEKNSEIVFRC